MPGTVDRPRGRCKSAHRRIGRVSQDAPNAPAAPPASAPSGTAGDALRYRPVPAHVDLPAMEREILDLWAEQGTFAASLSTRADAAALDLLRGPADRQRHPRHAPRRGPRLQGRLPALQDDAGLPRRPQGRLGLPRPAGRDRGREGAGLQRQARHRGVRHRRVQREVPRVRAAQRRPVRGDDRADGLLGRHVRPVPHDGRRPTSRASGGRCRRSSTRACWSRTTASPPTARAAAPTLSDHELAQGYETIVDPSVYVRFPLTSGPLAGRAPTCWSGPRRPGRCVQHRRRRCTPRSRTSSRPTATDRCRRRRAARRRGPRRGLGRPARRSPAATWSAGPTSARSTSSEIPDAHFVVLGDYVTTEDGTGLVHQSPAFGADDMAVCKAYGLPVVNPIARRRPLRGRRPARRRACSSRRPTRRSSTTSRRAACCSRELAYEHSLPALLALPHAADVLRAAGLVHPHDGASRTAARARTSGTNWFPEHDQARPLRRLADQQHRLVAVAQPLLGHSPADLAQRRRSGQARVRRVAGRAVEPDRPRPVRPRPAPSVHRRRHLRRSTASPAPTAACPRSSTPGSTPARCRSRSGATRTRRARRRSSSRPTRRSTSARRSTRPAAGSTR